MTDRRIVLAFGTRPEATKMAPVYRAIEHQTGLTPLILSTGQQRQMLDGALAVFGLTPDRDLNVMTERQTLADLFDGRSQLMIYHFMLGPGWEQGCPSCSYLADHFDGAAVHLAHRDVTFLVVSRAPLGEIETFQKRMGWRFKWMSSFGNDFNRDYHVSFGKDELEKKQVYYNYEVTSFPAEEAPGLSVFIKNEAGEVFHTYSTYGRGLDILVGTYNMLDLAPKGRDEDSLAFSMSWVRHHDRYDDKPVNPNATYQQPKAQGSSQGSSQGSCCD